PQAGALVRGTTIAVGGTALCSQHQFSQDGGEVITDVTDIIGKVEVRLGDAGAFALATPTGPVSPATGQKRWSSWTCTINPIAGVANDALKVTARVSVGTTTDDDSITVQVDRTPPLLTVTTPDPQQQPFANGRATFQVAGKASDALSAVVAVE